jgi:hypothetical protein
VLNRALTIQGSNDTINIVSDHSIGLALQGGGGTDHVQITGGYIGNIQTGGADLSISAKTIEIAPLSPSSNITLDTRNLDALGHTAGDSGKITLDGENISISHADLFTNVDANSGFAAGVSGSCIQPSILNDLTKCRVT